MEEIMVFGILMLGKNVPSRWISSSCSELFVYILQPFFVLSSLNIFLISALNPQKCYTVSGLRVTDGPLLDNSRPDDVVFSSVSRVYWWFGTWVHYLPPLWLMADVFHRKTVKTLLHEDGRVLRCWQWNCRREDLFWRASISSSPPSAQLHPLWAPPDDFRQAAWCFPLMRSIDLHIELTEPEKCPPPPHTALTLSFWSLQILLQVWQWIQKLQTAALVTVWYPSKKIETSWSWAGIRLNLFSRHYN